MLHIFTVLVIVFVRYFVISMVLAFITYKYVIKLKTKQSVEIPRDEKRARKCIVLSKKDEVNCYKKLKRILEGKDKYNDLIIIHYEDQVYTLKNLAILELEENVIFGDEDDESLRNINTIEEETPLKRYDTSKFMERSTLH